MKTALRFFFLFSIFSGFLFTSCEPVENSDTSDDARDAFTGIWRFLESQTLKSTDAQSYIVNITKDPADSSQVFIENFGNPGVNDIAATGKVSANQIVISTQSLSNGWTVEGSGKMSNVAGTEMKWTYTIVAGGVKEYFTAIVTKQ